MSDQHAPDSASPSLGSHDLAEQGKAQPAQQGFTESMTTEASTSFTAEEIATTSEEVKKSDQQESDNSNAFDQLLQHYRDMAATTRDLGNRFESHPASAAHGDAISAALYAGANLQGVAAGAS